MRSKDAITHLRKTGKVQEAVNIALGKVVLQESGDRREQTQRWLVPDQSALNQLILRLLQFLPGVKYEFAKTSRPGLIGTEVTISGSYGDGDIAGLTGGLGGMVRLDKVMPK